MTRRAVLISVVTGVLVVGAAAGGYLWQQNREQAQLDRDARAAAQGFARAWSARQLATARYAGQTPAQVSAGFRAATGGLGAVPVRVQLGSFTRHGDTGSGQLSVTWSVAGGSSWTYREPVAVRRTGKSWGVVADARTSLWYPGLPASARLVAKRTWGKRGEILDRNGTALLSNGTVHDVELDPARATPAAAAALEKIVQEPAGSLVAKLAAAVRSGSKAPILVITYREADFRSREAELKALPGVIYPPRQQPLGPTRTFGQPLLGSYGAVTAEMIKAGKGAYVAGDFAGTSGLQRRYDSVLGGTPGVQVVASSKPDAPLYERPARDGTDVTLTLDPKIQDAAESALKGSGSVPSALVAVDVKTGNLLAVANSPQLGFDRALQGRYQPGSTLKVATTYALLRHGVTPSTPVNCPPTVTVDGLKMQNYEGERLGTVPFSVDFAKSCNTAFVGATMAHLGPSDVHDAATALGVGAGWATHLGAGDVFDGSVPPATSKTEKASSAFGQGRTLASPAALAVMAGSVARGAYIEPALVTKPAVPGADRTPKALDAGTVSSLHDLMRLVVTSGTGTVLRSAPGGPVRGKTGTAEFGSATPPQTRAWFVGWQGDIAFAVLVEEGKSGGDVAAPLVKTFLTDLHR